MRDETRYTIYVQDDKVEIEGVLTIREGFDMLSYFDQQGFTTIEHNYESTTLTFRKRDFEKEERQRIIEESISDNNFYKGLYEKEQEQVKRQEIRIQQLDSLIKQIMEDGNQKAKELALLKNENAKFKAKQKLEEAIKSGVLHVEVEYGGDEENGGSTPGAENSCESPKQSDQL